MQSNDESFLSQYYGVYSIKMRNMAEITCVIMNNLLGKDFYDIKRIYDIKGSKVGRLVSLDDAERESSSGLKVLKDQNFTELNENLDIEPEEKD